MYILFAILSSIIYEFINTSPKKEPKFDQVSNLIIFLFITSSACFDIQLHFFMNLFILQNTYIRNGFIKYLSEHSFEF